MPDKIDKVKSWIDKANNDLASAETLFKYSSEIRDTVCFHCQQAVEKYLKAWLIHLDVTFPRTHELTYLLDLLTKIDDIDETYFDMAAVLEDYAVGVRYPDASLEPEESDVIQAIEYANSFKHFVANKIFNNGKSN